MIERLKRTFRLEGPLFPALVITALLLVITGRYLLYGVPHEFITGEYKGTFEGDYDFTLELVRAFAKWGRPPLWSETYSGPIAVFASNFHVFLQALLYPFTHNLALSIKILQVLELLTAGIGMYLLSSHLFKDRIAAAFSASLYIFTPFYIGHLLSYLHYTGVYMLAPLVFLLSIKTLRGPSLRSAALLSIITAYSLLSHPQNVFIGGIFYAIFYLMVFAREAISGYRGGRLPGFISRAVPLTVFVFVMVGLLSAFIMLPTLRDNYPYLRTSWVKGAGDLVKVDTGHIGSHSQTLLSAVTLQHWPWLQTPLKGGVYPDWPYMALYLTPFLFAAFSLLIRFDSLSFIFVAVAALSVQISLGVNGKPDLFAFASRHIPFFGMSRTPYTYINAAILSFCLLSSITFSWLSSRLSSNGLFKDACKGGGGGLARWLMFAVLIAPYLMAARHYGNDYNWTFISAREPRYLSQVRSWMSHNNKDRGRVIETCGIPTAMILGERMLPNQVDLLERYHRKAYLADYLSLFGMRYVITPSTHSRRSLTFDRTGYMVPSVFDRRESLEEYYSALTTEYYYMYERLAKDPDFSLHTALTKDVAIFENRKSSPPYEIYPASALMVLGGADSYDLLSLKRFMPAPAPVKGRSLMPAPLFIAQRENLERIDEIRDSSDALVLHNTDALDLGLLLGNDGVSLFKPVPVNPGSWELAIHSFGIQQPFPQHDHSVGNSVHGEMSFEEHAVMSKTRGSSARGEFRVDNGGGHIVMLRYMTGTDAPALSYSIDGAPDAVLKGPPNQGFNWVTLWEGALKPGIHTVHVTLDEDKPVFMDSFAVAPRASISKTVSSAGDFAGRLPVTYILNHRRFSYSGETLSATVRTAREDLYTLTVRLARFKEGGGGGGGGERPVDPSGGSAHQGDDDINVLIDGNAAGSLLYKRLDEEPREFAINTLPLAAGPHTITLTGVGDGVYFDLAALSTGTDAIGGGAGANREIGFSLKRTGPSSYSFTLDSKAPRFVVFNETNYPGWAMRSGKETVKPVIANMFMNGFILSGRLRGEDGSFRAEISYSNTAQNTGLVLSSVALGVAAVVIIAPAFSRRRREGSSRGGRGGRRRG